MNRLPQLTFVIAFFVIPISLVYSSPCYTNREGGCGNTDEKVIYVETKDTDFGFCTEYLNDNNKKVVRCHSNLSEEEKLMAKERAAAANQKPQETVVPIINYNFNYNVSSDSDQTNSKSGAGYNYGYNYFPNYNQINNNYHRPPNYDQDNNNNQQPSKPNQNVTLPSTPIGQKNGKFTPAKPASNNNTSKPSRVGSGSKFSPKASSQP